MIIYVYSATNNAFYPAELRETYEQSGTWPSDGVDVDDAMFTEFSGIAPEGKVRASDADGLPCWVDIPPPSIDELRATAEAEKRQLLAAANEHINSHQWPSKLALRRLSAAETLEFNAWLDYLDFIEAVDVTASVVEWPTQPETAAN